MMQLQAALNWVVAHWAMLFGILMAAASVVASIKNAMSYFPQQNKGVQEVESVLDKIADVLSWVSKNGANGPLAMLPGWLGALLGKASLPGFVSKQVAK